MDTEIAERMLDAVASVPPGRVVTYGDVAAMAGSTSPRLAGRVLAEMADESTPWHRVLRADGTPASSIAARQLALLAAEGVASVNGRIDLRRYRWQR